MEAEVAPDTFHIKAAELPDMITAGFTSIFIMMGAGFTLTTIDLVAVPAKLLALNV